MAEPKKRKTSRPRKSVAVSARIDPATARSLERLAAAHGRSKSWILAEAIRGHAAAEAEFLAAVDEGLRAAEAGRLISDAELDARLARAKRPPRRRAA
ncbi:MAG: ribbon-helix-helix protein, CopG family [Alphaproteobacteria bacterium]|nr:ribbon-helix-helix protein, CopG family [Alphaproteobacteria bacterium]